MRTYRSPFKQNWNIKARLRQFVQSSSPLNRLILINCSVYLAIAVLRVFVDLFGFLFVKENIDLIFTKFIYNWFAVPADLSVLIFKPWTLITSIFLHLDFLHLFFNMIMLWFGGVIFLQHFPNKSLYKVFLFGGLVGNAFFILSYNFFPVFSASSSVALGASGGVLSVLIAAATKAPNQRVNLLFLGQISLKWIALVFVAIDIISIPRGNSGGHLAHLGGALYGFLYAYFPNIKFSPKRQKVKKSKKQSFSSRPKTDEQYNAQRARDRKRTDEILAKISKSGYQHLTKEEKDFLFKTSQKKDW